MAALLNGFSSNRSFNAPRDLAGVERIEFLKGTAAALYGSSEPDGSLKIVSKRPLWNSAHAAELYLGSYGLKRGALDSTGPLGENLAYRLNVAVEDRDSSHTSNASAFAFALRITCSPFTRRCERSDYAEPITCRLRRIRGKPSSFGIVRQSA